MKMDRNLFEFEGHEVVRQFSLTRSGRSHELVLTMSTHEGNLSLRLINPRPIPDLYSIVEADQVWISLDPAADEGAGGVKVEFWHGGFGQFTADTVIELEKPADDTRPETRMDEVTQPEATTDATVESESLANDTTQPDTPLSAMIPPRTPVDATTQPHSTRGALAQPEPPSPEVTQPVNGEADEDDESERGAG